MRQPTITGGTGEAAAWLVIKNRALEVAAEGSLFTDTAVSSVAWHDPGWSRSVD